MDYRLFALYSLLIVLASLTGGWIPLLIQLNHRRMQVLLSLIAGFILGVAMLHLLPHAAMTVSVTTASGWALVGLLAMFFLERFFCFHHHDSPDEHADHDHPTGQCKHSHHDDTARHDHSITWVGAFIGLSVHSLVAGVALAASMTHGTDPAHDASAGLPLAGFAVFLVILLHKPFDSMTVGALLAHGNRTRSMRHFVNTMFALAVPAGGVLFIVGVGASDIEHSDAVGYALAFAAGAFLCISLSDLLPELQFHHHDRVLLSMALLLGLALAWGVANVENQSHLHSNGHDHDASVPALAAPETATTHIDLHEH